MDNDDTKQAVRALLQRCARQAAEALERDAVMALMRAAALRRWRP